MEIFSFAINYSSWSSERKNKRGNTLRFCCKNFLSDSSTSASVFIQVSNRYLCESESIAYQTCKSLLKCFVIVFHALET
jgi:hypothetical protein